MRPKLNIHMDTMVLAIVLWFCSLPLVALVIMPLFGRTTAVYVGLILLPLWLALCWGICSWRLIKTGLD